MSKTLNLNEGQRAERKTLVTIAEWNEYSLTTSEPSDWDTKYTDYYTKQGDAYIPVPEGESAPTWAASTYYKADAVREILGTRVTDSSIDLNADIETATDILGNTYTDVNKTEPQQTLDPSYVIGGSKISSYLYDAAIHNRIKDYNGAFKIYIVSVFLGTEGAYEAVYHKNCTIIPTSIGGESYVAMPMEIHFSNNIVSGTVDKVKPDFVFTEDVTI